MCSPETYAGGLRHLGGGAWLVGEEEWPQNPRHTVPRVFFHIARLWMRCRSGMGGFAVLPDAGGINDQAAWLMAAFSVLDGADAEREKREKREQ